MNQAIETLKASLQAQEMNASIHLLQGDLDQAKACAAKAGDLRAAIEVLEGRNQPTTVSADPSPEPAKTERELDLEKQLAAALEEVVKQKSIADDYMGYFLRVLEAAGLRGSTNASAATELVSAIEKVRGLAKILGATGSQRLPYVIDTVVGLTRKLAEEHSTLKQAYNNVCNTVNEISEGRRVQLDRLRDFAGMQSASDEEIVSQVIKHIEALRKNNESLFDGRRTLFDPKDPTPGPDDEAPSAGEIAKVSKWQQEALGRLDDLKQFLQSLPRS